MRHDGITLALFCPEGVFMSGSRSFRKRLLVMFIILAGLLSWTPLPIASSAPACVSANAATAPPPINPTVSEATRARLRDAYGNLPMRFERNQGQFDSRVQFAARGAGYALWLTAGEAVLSLQSGDRKSS